MTQSAEFGKLLNRGFSTSVAASIWHPQMNVVSQME
jgi:hypothetical protein